MSSSLPAPLSPSPSPPSLPHTFLSHGNDPLFHSLKKSFCLVFTSTSSNALIKSPLVRSTAHQPPMAPVNATATAPASTSRTQDLMSIYNLLNPDARASAPPLSRHSSSSTTSPSSATSAHHQLRNLTLNSDEPLSKEELLRQKRKIQSEKKRQWRRNLSPEQKERRQVLDAQRKREQRMNQTPEQRAESRKKDAARKAAKRRLMKEQMEKEKRQAALSSTSPHSPSFHASSSSATSSTSTHPHSGESSYSSNGSRKVPIDDLLNVHPANY